eukprot:767529-Hanusia_phi.AAC.7
MRKHMRYEGRTKKSRAGRRRDCSSSSLLSAAACRSVRGWGRGKRQTSPAGRDGGGSPLRLVLALAGSLGSEQAIHSSPPHRNGLGQKRSMSLRKLNAAAQE